MSVMYMYVYKLTESVLPGDTPIRLAIFAACSVCMPTLVKWILLHESLAVYMS